MFANDVYLIQNLQHRKGFHNLFRKTYKLSQTNEHILPDDDDVYLE
jgi:hypothetical protein